jgi:hypothetical protein
MAQKIIDQWINNNDHFKPLMLDNLDLDVLPDIPKECRYLFCHNNKLKKLPGLSNCESLCCGNNELRELPELSNCYYLSCCNNLLTRLPDLPNCFGLTCSNNKLTVLPDLVNCSCLEFSDNDVLYLPRISPKPLIRIILDNNKYLHINQRQAADLGLVSTPNYHRCVLIIQRVYRRFVRRRSLYVVNKYLFVNVAKIVSLYII